MVSEWNGSLPDFQVERGNMLPVKARRTGNLHSGTRPYVSNDGCSLQSHWNTPFLKLPLMKQ